eukprot:51606-Eustigmatos_ZCMA.PRE.1
MPVCRPLTDKDRASSVAAHTHRRTDAITDKDTKREIYIYTDTDTHRTQTHTGSGRHLAPSRLIAFKLE